MSRQTVATGERSTARDGIDLYFECFRDLFNRNPEPSESVSGAALLEMVIRMKKANSSETETPTIDLGGKSACAHEIGPLRMHAFIDKSLPEDVIEFRDGPFGKLLGRIINVGK